MKQFLLVCAFLCAFVDYRVAFAQANQIHVGLSVLVSQAQLAPRTPTMADALALKSTGRIAASPNGAQVAIEAEGEILILSAKDPFVRVKVLNGSYPTWSPDGAMLAFYADIDGKSQIEGWN